MQLHDTLVREREYILLLFMDDGNLYGRDKIAVAGTQKISR